MEITKSSLLERALSAGVEQGQSNALLAGIRLDVNARNVGAARALVRLRLQVEGTPAESVDSAALIVSELAGNVVKYHDWDLEPVMVLGLVRDGRTLRIEVHDSDPAVPQRLTPDAMSEGGRGLLVVEALSERWGVGRTDEGKFVWSEFQAWPECGDVGAAERAGTVSGDADA